MRKGRVHLGRVGSSDRADYWELRITPATGTGTIARIELTAQQFSDMMSAVLVTDVDVLYPTEEE